MTVRSSSWIVTRTEKSPSGWNKVLVMIGTVHRIEADVVAINTPGGYTIVKLAKQTRIDCGDEIEWHPDRVEGRRHFLNRTRGSEVTVRVLNHNVHESILEEQMGLR